ncbi:MAG: AAA-like domain-containing protein [Candidatus Binataceae bacterium]
MQSAAGALARHNPVKLRPGVTALDSTQLNAAADIQGTFAYTPAAGTVLHAGVNHLSTTFTPSDIVHYIVVTRTTTIAVGKAAPTLSWATPADIVYGTALSATQLNATASVPGQFLYTPAVGTVLDPGANQVLSVTFTPDDTTDYTPVTARVALNVTKPLAVAILYRHNVELDESLLHRIEAELAGRGHQVFVDRHLRIGVEWGKEIPEKVRSADWVIPLLSARSVQSEMLAQELQIAHEEAQQHNGLPRILPVRVAFEDPLPPELAVILDRLQYFLWRGPQDDNRLLQELLAALDKDRPPEIKPPRRTPFGGLPLDSNFYLERSMDRTFHAAIDRRDSLILLSGSRQAGKTSLLARGGQHARKVGARFAFTDFQGLNRSELESLDAFYEALGQGLAEELDSEVSPTSVWKRDRAPNFNFERYLRTEVLEKEETPVIWALDEVDRLFSCPFRSEVFGLFRTWHNQRAGLGKHAGLWGRLTLIIAYATEAHPFIPDLDQSPFNVGTKITLEDFTPEQVAELNRRYDHPLHNDKEQKAFYDLVGGHPYLTNRGLFELAENNLDLASFQAQAARDEWPFGDHLRRIFLQAEDQELPEAIRGVLEGRPHLTPRSFYRLRAAGVLAGDSPTDARPRCQLYATYLRKHLI